MCTDGTTVKKLALTQNSSLLLFFSFNLPIERVLTLDTHAEAYIKDELVVSRENHGRKNKRDLGGETFKWCRSSSVFACAEVSGDVWCPAGRVVYLGGCLL